MTKTSLPTLLGSIAAMSLLVAAFFLALWRGRRARSGEEFSFGWLAMAFAAYGVRALGQAAPAAPGVLFASGVAYVGWTWGLWHGILGPRAARLRRSWRVAAFAALVAWIALVQLVPVPYPWHALPHHAVGTALFADAALHLIARGRDPALRWDSRALGILLAVGAASTAAYPFARPTAYAAWGFSIAAAIALVLGMGVIVTAFRSEHFQLAREIAARAASEQALRASEEALRASVKLDAIARLAGGVAHDFNNLLTAILGTSDLLLERLTPEDPLRGPAADIHEAAEKAAGLTRQLLTFSRRQLVQPVVLEVGELLATTAPMLRRLAGSEAELVVQPGPPARVRIDRGQLVQVLAALVANARDATAPGGRIEISATTTQLGEDEARRRPGLRPGRHAVLAVSDAGRGMSAEVKAHLFEPFFTTKLGAKGTGLGLSTVYGIVTQAGGHVAVESEPGRGSRFSVYLPVVTDEATPAAGRRASGAAPRGAETLLLVEDEAVVRRLASRVLRGAGYTVLEAADGEEAVALLAAPGGERVQAVVTDVVMPRMGGEALADWLARERPGTPVLFMSGYTDHRAEFQQRIDEGAALLQKPFSPDALARAVRELIDGRGGTAARRG